MKLIYLFFLLTMFFSCAEKYTGEVSFKSCTIKYDILDEKKEHKINGQNRVGNQWRFESAKQELALCLCEKYLQNRDKEIKEKILTIYRDDFQYYHRENKFKPIDFDSILKSRKEIFDYRILAD
ncbi:hypothetical protein [Chryseobacterium chendengshani]|uniref:hypothetical protein n=1 Tax=Chryseobacterium sp. LJ756 TaxID=2864113 RepID=UPI001C63DFF4|nr:hypothetical protein [Chryseobacterium sp. LJ756]MBW7674803.1 hypothetical protein [Chryseobacterium sp. LJ756]